MGALDLVQIVLRVLEFIFTTLVLSLSAALIAQNRRGGTPARVNYSIYSAIWSMLCLFYLIPATFFTKLHVRAVAVVLDILCTIFLVCAGIAMAASLGGRSCNGYWVRYDGITQASSKRCSEAQAMTVFEWFAAVCFLASALVGAVGWKKERSVARLDRSRATV